MVDRKGSAPIKRRVWRVTRNAPHGEYVDPDELGSQRAARTQHQPEPGWLMSSFELTHGVEVSDQSNTIPGELFDELFTKKT